MSLPYPSLMAYDAESDRIVLLGGGMSPTNCADVVDVRVWAYDYNSDTWTTQEAPSNAPAQRAGFGLFHHPPSGRMFVFGGKTELGGQMAEETTWAYDYGTNAWEALEPSKNPGKHAFFPMTYAPSVDKAIMFGGELVDKWADEVSEEVWIFDPSTNGWQEAARP